MRKIYPSLFNKFTVLIFYGLLSVAVITLAQLPSQQTTGGKGGGGTIPAAAGDAAPAPSSPSPSPSSNECPLAPSSGGQKTIGYIHLDNFDPKNIQSFQWNLYDYINVIAYPKVTSTPWNDIHPPSKSLSTLSSLVAKKQSTKILLSIRNYDITAWPTDEPGHKIIMDETTKIIANYSLDGVDIEYPGMRGSYCKSISVPSASMWDQKNDQTFANFIKGLHDSFNGNKTLMLTAGSDVIIGLNNSIIDYLNIETYHYSFYENYKETQLPFNVVKSNPNAPLNIYEDAYYTWTNNRIGIEKQKIIMGVDFGNTLQIVNNSDILTVQTVESDTHDASDVLNDFNNLTRINFCPGGFNTDKLKLYSFPWSRLVTENFVTGNCDTASSGWDYHFDESTSTSWLSKDPNDPSNPSNQNPKYYYYLSFEGFHSLNRKLIFSTSNLIGGISISDVSYDDNSFSLINYIQATRNGQSASPTPTGSQKPQGTSSGDVNPSSSVASTNDSPNKDDRKPGVIAGAVIGSVFGLIIIGGIAFFGYKNKDKLPFGQNKYSKDMLYNPGTNMNQGMIIPENSQRTILQDTAAIPVAPSYVTAMFDFMGKEENDLSFKKGDKIEVLERGDGPNDWWVGRVNGAVGEFPGNYVKE